MSCRTGQPGQVCGTPGEPATAESQLSTLAARYWDERMQSDPLEATEIGDRRFDDRMPDISLTGRERDKQRLRGLRVEVERVPEGALDAGNRITRALLLGEIDADLARAACDLEDWAVDAREGPQVTYLRMPDLQPVTTALQGRALAARWRAMGPTIDEEITNLRRGLANGKVATRDETTRVLAQLDELLAKPDRDWPLHAPAAAPHADWPAEERARYTAAVDQAIATGIRPAFARYRDFVRAQVLPRARDEAHAGIMFVPDGPACYRRLIKVHTSLDLAPEEIHRIGLEALARVRTEMQALGQQALGTADLAEIQRRMRSDRSLYFKTRDEVEAAARAVLARAQAAEPRFLGHLPRTPCVVKRIDAFEERDAPSAYYRPAAVDGSRPGTYSINTFDPESRPRFESEVLAFHESVPGHHIQISIAQELTGLPEFRKQIGVTAFVEGWALYAEGMADELGLYSGPLDRLGRLSFAAWRASRLVVDTGMHAFGWSRARAITFMEENTVLAHANIVNEVDRYIAWPGQALAYKLGEREIRRLRADAERRLGPRFDLRAFNDAVLAGGAVSLAVLGQEVDAWVKQTLSQPSPPNDRSPPKAP